MNMKSTVYHNHLKYVHNYKPMNLYLNTCDPYLNTFALLTHKVLDIECVDPTVFTH